MSKIYTDPFEMQAPKIEKASVAKFFEERAKKISTLGAVQAVIYQDKNPELAAQRNKAEKAKLLPLLQLNGTQRILDVGCGTGRWAEDVLSKCSWYHGIDATDGLIKYAQEKYTSFKHCRFSIASANNFSLNTLSEKNFFDRVLCMGVLIYLNDDELLSAIRCMAQSLSTGGLLLIREPIGIDKRLTISSHYSDEMEQNYNAIYRTQEEILNFINMINTEDLKLRVLKNGDVYDNMILNNRTDTKQIWLLLERL